MPFNVDPNTVYPIGITVFVVACALIGFKIFPTNNEFQNRMNALELKMAEKYVAKEDFDKKLDEFKSDMHANLNEIKATLVRLFDKLEELRR